MEAKSGFEVDLKHWPECVSSVFVLQRFLPSLNGKGCVTGHSIGVSVSAMIIKVSPMLVNLGNFDALKNIYHIII